MSNVINSENKAYVKNEFWKTYYMVEKRTFNIDRRSRYNRRKVYNLDYFLNGGADRRKIRKRRSLIKHRSDWCRISDWYSVSQQSLENSCNLLF